jgi:hypothetical protein
MHEGGALTWREVVDKHHSALIDELSVRLDSDLREAVAQAAAAERSESSRELKRACDEAGRSRVESLDQILRRLRTAAEEQILPLFAEVCAPYAEQLVVLVFESNQARSVASVGIPNQTLLFETGLAPAILTAIDSRDPVVALATETEISPVLAEVFGMNPSLAPGGKAYLFPIVARHSVVAMLIASGVPVSAPIELLCEAAGMRLEAVARKTQPVQPANGKESRQAPVVAWDGLNADDQRLHLQAQRMARLRVAEMRLYHEDRLRSGAAAGDIYGALQSEIDPARSQFLQMFLSKSPTMVDYLHLEILRSLAHNDDSLLGHRYPGPMV